MNKVVINRDGNKWLINGKESTQARKVILGIILYPFIVVGLLVVIVCTTIFAIAAVAVVIAGLPILLLPGIRREIKEKGIYGRKDK